MIVEQFIQWVVTAAPEKRAKATHALARAYLQTDFVPEDMDAAEAAMTFLLDDPEKNVRLALADVLSSSENAPRHIILSLLDDELDISTVVAVCSPVLMDDELVDIVATGELPLQFAVAGRSLLSASVSAAIAEVTSVDVCQRLLENSGATILTRTLLRLTERFGDDQLIQQLLLDHENLPIAARQLILANLSDALCDRAVKQSRMDMSRAEDVSREARDRATLTLAYSVNEEELSELIVHLRDTEQLTTVLMLRAICAGQMMFFVEGLSLLSGVSRSRVIALLNDDSRKLLRTLYIKSGLPEQAYPAFSIAFDVYVEQGAVSQPSDQFRFTRIMIERILERYRGMNADGMDDLLTMLRRFVSETARDAARNYVNHQIKAA